MSDLTDLTARLNTRIRTSGDYLLPAATVTEALRSALGRLAECYGTPLTLAGLDQATTTSLATADFETLLMGAELQILVSLLAGHFTDFSGTLTNETAINERIRQAQIAFEAARENIRRRYIQTSTDSPHSAWQLDEDFDYLRGDLI